MTVVALLVLLQDPDLELARFRESNRRAKDDAGRASAIATLALLKHERTIKPLAETLSKDDSVAVKEACVQALSQYSDSKDAAAVLVEFLAAVRKSRHRGKLAPVAEKAIEALSMMHRDVARSHVEAVHGFLKETNLALVVRAVQALGRIRHKSSIPELLELMRTTQREIKQLIQTSQMKEAAGT